MVLRLVAGHPAPTQQSSVSCGGACLVVARMTLDAAYATYLSAGDEEQRRRRFAEQEREMMRRANGWRVRGRNVATDLPWPGCLGTSPWGARDVLESGTGIRYRFDVLRGRRHGDIAHRVCSAARPGAPALLYVGDRLLPRHVTLVTAPADESLVYEPARGLVLTLHRAGRDARPPVLGGWQTSWFLIAPASDST